MPGVTNHAPNVATNRVAIFLVLDKVISGERLAIERVVVRVDWHSDRTDGENRAAVSIVISIECVEHLVNVSLDAGDFNMRTNSICPTRAMARLSNAFMLSLWLAAVPACAVTPLMWLLFAAYCVSVVGLTPPMSLPSMCARRLENLSVLVPRAALKLGLNPRMNETPTSPSHGAHSGNLLVS